MSSIRKTADQYERLAAQEQDLLLQARKNCTAKLQEWVLARRTNEGLNKEKAKSSDNSNKRQKIRSLMQPIKAKTVICNCYRKDLKLQLALYSYQNHAIISAKTFKLHIEKCENTNLQKNTFGLLKLQIILYFRFQMRRVDDARNIHRFNNQVILVLPDTRNVA
ncbi:hypothetical protein BDC45DRAFT_535361 [Circinella umbellata]|nr:hypothetical protein BDC45DRAFT_535361 [Circinella umbellata]